MQVQSDDTHTDHEWMDLNYIYIKRDAIVCGAVGFATGIL